MRQYFPTVRRRVFQEQGNEPINHGKLWLTAVKLKHRGAEKAITSLAEHAQALHTDITRRLSGTKAHRELVAKIKK